MSRLAALWLGLLAATATAHEVRPAFLKISEQAGGDGDVGIFTASFRQPRIGGRFLGLTMLTDCEQTMQDAGVTDGALIETLQLRCPDGEPGLIAIGNLERTMIDTLVTIQSLDGSVTNHLVTAAAPRLVLDAPAPSLPVYLSIGFTHLVQGYDHIVFVLLLLYLVRTPWMIFKVVTSFTLAHSLTLGLSAVDLVQLSQRPVEAVIAASIVLLAFEILRPQGSPGRHYPALLAFFFGLLHGLGFAGALAEIGLPENARLSALLLFNVGIELGQLAIIAVVIGLFAQARRRLPLPVYQAPVFLAGGIGSYWFLERAWMIIFPVVV